MNVIYLYHSGFVVETEKEYLVFDYYKERMPAFDVNKKVYFFVSHTHPDHFNPKIFEYASDNVVYILAKDVEEKIVYRHMLDVYENVDITYVEADENIEIDELKIITYKSTDRGVAFMVQTGEGNVYHAGDLNAWLMSNMDKAKRGDMLARFKRELEKMKGSKVKAAFIPLDPRLEKDYATGFHMYCEALNPEYIFPMHMWEKYEYIELVKKEEYTNSYRDRIMKIGTPGERYEL